MLEQALEFVGGRAPITLPRFADQTKTLERHARQVDEFDRHVDTTHGGSMGEHQLEVAENRR